MGAREQFAGWGMYDNTAVCLTCGVQHLVPKAEQITVQPWLDWLTKHPDGHETFIVPHKLLGRLGEVAAMRHNADAKVAYAASAGYTITLTGLASSSTLLVGREGTGVSNASNKYIDELVAARIHVNEASAVTASTYIELHVVGSLDDTPTYPDVFDGTDSGETIQSAGTKAAICRLVGAALVDATTTNLPYWIAPLGIRQLFGDALPPAHVPFVVHNTGQALGATAANHYVKHTPVYATVV